MKISFLLEIGKCKFPLLIVFLLFSLVSFTSAQEITEENYKKIDWKIWEEYEEEVTKLSEYKKRHPEKRDSLDLAFDKVYKIVNKKNVEAAIKYATVPSGLQRLFMVRLQIPKDTLYSVLKSLPDSAQNAPYGKSILKHLETDQIEEGSHYYDFKAIDVEGNEFSLSSLEGKKILLLYGGLGCMGEEGRKYLDSLYDKTDRKDFEIVVYSLNSDLKSLQETQRHYSSNYILVSDFLQDHTPVKILYGAQSTPTCFFINEKGIVEMKTGGLHPHRVDELLGKSETL